MSLTNLIIVLVFSLVSVTVSHTYRGDACKSREGVSGVCRPIEECPLAIKELRARRRPTNCAFEGFTPIVCCIEDPRGTTTREPSHAAVIGAVPSGDDKKPEDSLEKSSEDTIRTTTPPSKLALIVAVIPGEGRKVEEKSGIDTVDGESVISSKRKPGVAATYWCERFVKKCKSSQGRFFQIVTRPSRRFKRAMPENKIPDYEEFGTTERPANQRYRYFNFNHHFIVGGEEAFMDEFPHMAAVGFGKQSDIRWECGGSLISDTFVLTAAHCLIARDGSAAEWVLLGSQYISDQLRGYSKSSNGVIYHVIRRIRHPGYKRSSKYNDLALLELGPSLQYDETVIPGAIHPACLQVEWDVSLTRVTASGWGRLGHGDNPSSSLQKVKLNILDNSVCNESYAVEMKLSKLVNGIDASMICAGDLKGGKDTCQGDSGGPLQFRTDSCLTHVIGVTSFGKVCGFAGSPAIYMRISHFIPWIESIVWPE